MAGFVYFKGPTIQGEVTQGGLLDEAGPNNEKGGPGSNKYYWNWIELNSVTQTVTRAIETGRSGTARARSGTVLEEIECEKEVDSTTVPLIQHCSGGTAFTEVWIHLCTSLQPGQEGSVGTSLQPYLELRLFSVKITNYSVNGSGLDDGSIPTESVNLNFDKIQWRYWPIGPTALQPTVNANDIGKQMVCGWDILKQAPFSA